MSTKRRERVEPGIYRRPDRKLEIGWRDGSGKQRWRTVHGGIKAARAELAAEHARRARGERVAPPRLTFAAALDASWEQRRRRLVRSSRGVYEASGRRVRKHFGSRRLGAITVGDIANYVTAHGSLSAETLRKDLSMISGAFTYATRHLGYSGPNPVLLLERFERPQGDSKPKRILGPSELRELLLATDPRYRLAIRFLVETGVRLSELLGLAWGDVDLDGETVEVAWQLDAHTRGRVKLKTDRSRRAIPITAGLAGELRDLRPRHAGSHEFVFCERDGRPYSQKQIERVLDRAATRAGLGDVLSREVVVEHAPTPHDLRHSHASALIASGWDVEAVSRRLGHAHSGITLATYTHEFEAARRQAEQRRSLDALYGSALPLEAPVEAKDRNAAQQTEDGRGAEVAVLQARRSAAQ